MLPPVIGGFFRAGNQPGRVGVPGENLLAVAAGAAVNQQQDAGGIDGQ